MVLLVSRSATNEAIIEAEGGAAEEKTQAEDRENHSNAKAPNGRIRVAIGVRPTGRIPGSREAVEEAGRAKVLRRRAPFRMRRVCRERDG